MVVANQSRAFVGRATEMAELERAFLATLAGQTVVVHIHGQSGIGKTALIATAFYIS